MKINDDELNEILMEISQKIDEKLAEICTENMIDPYIASSIILARLYKMNESFNTGPQFIKLMRQCAEDTELRIHPGDESNVH